MILQAIADLKISPILGNISLCFERFKEPFVYTERLFIKMLFEITVGLFHFTSFFHHFVAVFLLVAARWQVNLA